MPTARCSDRIAFWFSVRRTAIAAPSAAPLLPSKKSFSELIRRATGCFGKPAASPTRSNKGEVALAQIYGLRISINELDPQQLAKLSATARLTKTGYNPDEPRLPKGDRHGGEWTTGGGGSEASTITGHPTGPFAIDAMTVDSSTGGGDSGDGDASAGTPASGDNANGGGRRNQRRRSPPSSGR